MSIDDQQHRQQHTPEAVRARLEQATTHSYLRDFVFGAIDGTVTTFAVVSGVAGAGLGGGVAVILGFANLLADGLSMAVSNYLGTKADVQLVDQVRRTEEQHIARFPEGEREEIRQIFLAKGLEGEVLEEVVSVITRDRQRWIETMVTEEWGLRLNHPSPFWAGLATYAAFILAGLVPLLPLLLPVPWNIHQQFAVSTLFTGITFFLIGMLKGRVVERPLWSSGLETLLLGGLAAGVAYGVGTLLQGLAPGG